MKRLHEAHQFPVVEDPALVHVGELLGEGDGVLPVLAALQQVDHVQVQLLLPLPLLLRRVSEKEGNRLDRLAVDSGDVKEKLVKMNLNQQKNCENRLFMDVRGFASGQT